MLINVEETLIDLQAQIDAIVPCACSDSMAYLAGSAVTVLICLCIQKFCKK